MWSGFGVLAATAAQVGPLVLARNGPKRCGGRRREFGAWAETDILGQPARDSCNSRGKLAGECDRSLSGLVPPEIAKAGHPVEDGNDGWENQEVRR